MNHAVEWLSALACGTLASVPSGPSISPALAQDLAPTLAWRPFLDPMPAHRAWFLLLVPLAIGISLAYKAVRAHGPRRYARDVAVMSAQIVAAMILMGAAAYVFVDHVLPRLAPMEW